MAKKFIGDVNIYDGDDLIRGTLAIKLTPSPWKNRLMFQVPSTTIIWKWDSRCKQIKSLRGDPKFFIYRYSSSRTKITEWGGFEGLTDGKFSDPSGIAIDPIGLDSMAEEEDGFGSSILDST